MNINHIYAVSLAGFQYWLSDKKTIFMRLFLWPNLVPMFFIVFVGIGLGVMLIRSVPESEVSKFGGVSFTVYGEQEYSSVISDVLSDKKTNFSYRNFDDLSESRVQSLIKNKEITFALKVVTYDNARVDISIVYDRERDYVHKKWIDAIKDSGPEIALSIRKHRLSLYPLIFDKSLTSYILSPIHIDVAAFGKLSGSVSAAIMVFLLWGALFVAPLDSAASVASTQMLSDTSEDFISIWKAAGVRSGDMVIGRFLTALCVYIFAVVIFFFYIYAWTSLYIYIVDILVGAMSKDQLRNEDLYALTRGFKELVENIKFGHLISFFLMLISTGAFIILIRLRLSLYIENLEQVRSLFKPIEIILYNLPIVGFIAGSFTANFMTSSIPVINQLVVLQYFFKDGAPYSFMANALMVNALFTLLLYFSTSKHVGSQDRLIHNKGKG